VKFLGKTEEFELSKYCREDVLVWWREEMAYGADHKDGIDTWILEVGEHEIPEVGFLPYEFNFSERWVVLDILETFLDDGFLNMSVKIENLDNRMIIEFNFRSYGGSPYPINENHLERDVRCPAEEFTTYNTGAAIAVGGVSAIALVVGVAAWRRRRFDEVVGVPEPFVGSDVLITTVPSLEVDSSN
jgi:hypothetical protein